ncbi:hypothetical protein [Accumulibacter sp.]|uniref:hypothetical protein n=1 Tax=Accumulibacter sp. TaxID=2053492 RepID=UPI0028C4319B|nr:hypothetical protein [Accumulibacter sp.]
MCLERRLYAALPPFDGVAEKNSATVVSPRFFRSAIFLRLRSTGCTVTDPDCASKLVSIFEQHQLANLTVWA